jgi:excisionase family DNA binding protein
MAKARNKIRVDVGAPGKLGIKWLTTGQISRRLGVAQRTVTKWIDDGRLNGIRLPGSRDRRVHPDALEEFERHYGFDRARGMRE